jgi:hypothetical protein
MAFKTNWPPLSLFSRRKNGASRQVGGPGGGADKGTHSHDERFTDQAHHKAKA